MAICIRCDKSGLFSSVDKNRLCKECAKEFSDRMAEADRSIQHTLFLIHKEVDPEEKLRRCEKLFEALGPLSEFETLGLPAQVAKRKREFKNFREGFLMDGIVQATHKALDRATIAKTWPEKAQEVETALARLEEVRASFPQPEVLDSLKEKAQRFLGARRLEAMIEKCHEAEYEGNDNLALERYRATWEFLQRDRVDHPQRAKISASVQERLRRLEQKINR